MCGIIGYVGKRKVLPILTQGLMSLEYRGYDSAGVAYFKEDNIEIVKSVGRIEKLKSILDINTSSNIGIGHTRWATHGNVSVANAHPHQQNKITLVHNGIIENYNELKKELVNMGYTFNGTTDTEIAASYIDYLYNKYNDMLIVLAMLKDIFIGSYALAILVKNDPNNIYVVKKGSPLIIGYGNDENFIASDISAILKYTNKYSILEDDEIAKISINNVLIYKNNEEIKKDILTYTEKEDVLSLDGYEHYMLKEINEQPNLISTLIKKYINKESTLPDLTKYKDIYIVGCGSAYHAGLIGKYLIEEYVNIPVNVVIASEFRYQKLFLNENSLVIAISQSGETADTLESVKIAKKYKAKTLGIINTYGSSIARICDEVIYINAGIEVAVATTKAYSLQVLILSLLAVFNSNKKIDTSAFLNYSDLVKDIVKTNYTNLARLLYDKDNIFFIGRLVDYAIAMEGSLKLKEISYINTSCYPSGELKHGTISLIEENTPVIAIITDDKIAKKTISNIKETKARGAYVILLVKDTINVPNDIYDEIIKFKATSDLLDPISAVINLQLLSYYIAKEKGTDIDKPKNLAKSVTVE